MEVAGGDSTFEDEIILHGGGCGWITQDIGDIFSKDEYSYAGGIAELMYYYNYDYVFTYDGEEGFSDGMGGQSVLQDVGDSMRGSGGKSGKLIYATPGTGGYLRITYVGQEP